MARFTAWLQLSMVAAWCLLNASAHAQDAAGALPGPDRSTQSERSAVPAPTVGEPSSPAASCARPPCTQQQALSDAAVRSEAYQRAIDAALDEHERGNFEESREHFRRAHEIYPSARTLRGLGKVEFELRNYGESAKLLQAALDSSERPLDAALRSDVERVLDRARAYIGQVHVNVQPDSATVSVDGITVASGPSASLSLMVGDHTLEFHAHGHQAERRAVRVLGREQTSLQVVLSKVGGGASSNEAVNLMLMPVDERTSKRDRHQEQRVKRRWIWGTIGAVAAAGLVTTIVVLARRDRKDEPDTHVSTPNTQFGPIEALWSKP